MPTYGTTDRCTGGTASANAVYGIDHADHAVANDGNASYWYATSGPCWWKYDFGAGVAWRISKLIMQCANIVTKCGVKNFTVQGSNNDSDYTTLYTGITVNNNNEQTFTWTNKVSYRYIKINVIDDWDATGYALICEVQMFEGIYPSTGFILFIN